MVTNSKWSSQPFFVVYLYYRLCNKTDFTKLFIKIGGIMRPLSFLVIVTLGLISMSGRAISQVNSNSPGLLSPPNNPPVGIGTQAGLVPVPQNALHIHYD